MAIATLGGMISILAVQASRVRPREGACLAQADMTRLPSDRGDVTRDGLAWGLSHTLALASNQSIDQSQAHSPSAPCWCQRLRGWRRNEDLVPNGTEARGASVRPRSGLWALKAKGESQTVLASWSPPHRRTQGRARHLQAHSLITSLR